VKSLVLTYMQHRALLDTLAYAINQKLIEQILTSGKEWESLELEIEEMNALFKYINTDHVI